MALGILCFGVFILSFAFLAKEILLSWPPHSQLSIKGQSAVPFTHLFSQLTLLKLVNVFTSSLSMASLLSMGRTTVCR